MSTSRDGWLVAAARRRSSSPDASSAARSLAPPTWRPLMTIWGKVPAPGPKRERKPARPPLSLVGTSQKATPFFLRRRFASRQQPQKRCVKIVTSAIEDDVAQESVGLVVRNRTRCALSVSAPGTASPAGDRSNGLEGERGDHGGYQQHCVAFRGRARGGGVPEELPQAAGRRTAR